MMRKQELRSFGRVTRDSDKGAAKRLNEISNDKRPRLHGSVWLGVAMPTYRVHFFGISPRRRRHEFRTDRVRYGYAQDAIDLAHRLVHPFSLAVAHSYAAMLHQFRREPKEVRARADAVRLICTEHGFSYYRAWAAIMNGWAVAEEGDAEDGIARVRVGVRDLRATGAELRLPHYFGILADIYRRAQRLDDAAVALAEARAVAERNDEHWTDANLHLIEGDLALAIGDQAQAESCLRRAMKSAQAQNARALLLRGSTKLVRLLAAGDRRAEAYDELAKIYGSFTEGFETVDSREAKAVLDGIC